MLMSTLFGNFALIQRIMHEIDVVHALTGCITFDSDQKHIYADKNQCASSCHVSVTSKNLPPAQLRARVRIRVAQAQILLLDHQQSTVKQHGTHGQASFFAFGQHSCLSTTDSIACIRTTRRCRWRRRGSARTVESGRGAPDWRQTLVFDE